MSYRIEWRKCKLYFPNVYCAIFGDGFRIVTDKTYKEINSIGNGKTRKRAWQDSARNVDFLSNQIMPESATVNVKERGQ